MTARLLRSLAALAALALVTPLGAQYLTRPAQPWQTIETKNFLFHFPEEMRPWVLPVAQRMESYAAAVQDLVGGRPAERTTVMVEDPSNLANGFAVPLLEGPTIFLWPTPPTPEPTSGAHRGWGEILAVHEFAHIAHLGIPSRNGAERALWRLAPSRVGPVARKSPAWVTEGYATYIEGRLTGSGRPHSVGRAAILRQWALEGRLPSYAELGATRPFLGGSMRYLVGSAFLEWLAARKGDVSLQHLWRRLSAAQRRSFADAFRGVYGTGPDDLYGVFHTEITEKALDARRALRRAALVEGELVQHLDWGTGDPAVSRDGSMVAVVLRSPGKPSRVVVWRTADEPLPSQVADARRQALARDPLDVAPFDSFPPARRPEATLFASAGRGYDQPRWFADNERLLVTRDVALGDGATRPDLFVWNRRSGGLRRVTRGAGIRGGDPAPDGRTAAGVRCRGGVCDLVIVGLDGGAVSTLAAGSPTIVWHRPRFSPDGKRIAAAIQRDGRWEVAIVDAGSGALRPTLAPDGVNRYAPSWTTDGKLVVVSERGGIPNLELVDPESRVGTMLTRLTGAANDPDVGPDGRIWFLSLHAKGYDLRRIGTRAALASGADRVVALDAGLEPAAPRAPVAGVAFREGPVDGPRDYGFGPRRWRVLPGLNWGPDGDMLSLMLANVDPVGRLGAVLQGGTGQKGAWRGGSLAMALRSSRVHLEGDAWVTSHKPSEQLSGTFASPDIDSRYKGVEGAASWGHEGGALGLAARMGATLGRVDGSQLDAASRVAVIGDVRLRLTIGMRGTTVAPQVVAHRSQGETAGDRWDRTRYTASLAVGRWLRLEATRGRTTSADAGEFGRAYEQFTLGGGAVPFLDPSLLSQRVAIPSVPVGFATGSRLELYRAAIRVRGLEPYAMWVAAGDTISGYQRVIGLEDDRTFPAIGFVRLPSARMRIGVGYSFDAPYHDKLRPYVSLTYRP